MESCRSRMMTYTCLAMFSYATTFGNSPPESDDALERSPTSVLMREAHQELEQIEQAGRRGRLAEAEPALERYTRRMEIVNSRLNQDSVRTSHNRDALGTAATATSRHSRILAHLLPAAPDQARPRLMRALDASRIGHRTAVKTLQSTPAGQRGPGPAPQQRRPKPRAR